MPSLAITEVTYLLATRLGWQPEVRFLGDMASGNFTLEPVHAADLLRMAELVARYHDLTLDRRHFSVVRARHTETLRLLP